MTRVLLINQESIAPYRIGVYNHLGASLQRAGYALTVASEGAQNPDSAPITFDHRDMPLNFARVARLIWSLKPDVVIYWVRLRHLYLFPTLLLLKLLGRKAVYWGHGRDLGGGRLRWLRQWLNHVEYRVSDALILYGEPQRRYVPPAFQPKTFIANNTLCFEPRRKSTSGRQSCLARHGITTPRNIVCLGRMQRRKRLEDLWAAFDRLDRPEVGLVLIGPDSDGLLRDLQGRQIHKLGPIYGQDRLELLSACDVFCLPGAVGLGIVDAFHCGLPLVTEAGDESPELMYLKDGVNGFVVPRGDIGQLTDRLRLLLDDEGLREKFSRAAREEIETHGHIDRMCEGFRQTLDFVCERTNGRADAPAA